MGVLLSAPNRDAMATGRPVRGRRRLVGLLALYGVSRAALLVEAAVIAARNHSAVASVLMPWDGGFYLSIATIGYPARVVPLGASTIAFFPLFPILGRGLADATGLGIDWSLVVVSLASGAAVTVLGWRLAVSALGDERGLRSGALLAVFPGSVVAGLLYADALGVAFALAALLLATRGRYVVAGLLGALATASLSLLVVPLACALAWSALRTRRIRSFCAPAISLCGGGAYLVYLWIHTGSPFTWSRVERAGWLVHPSLPWQDLTAFSLYPFTTTGSAVLTASSIALAALGLFALFRVGAPGEWVVLAALVLAAVTFDGGAWIAPRFLFDGAPLVLAIGAATPRRAFPAVVVLSLAGLVFLLAAYSPVNRVFFSP